MYMYRIDQVYIDASWKWLFQNNTGFLVALLGSTLDRPLLVFAVCQASAHRARGLGDLLLSVDTCSVLGFSPLLIALLPCLRSFTTCVGLYLGCQLQVCSPRRAYGFPSRCCSDVVRCFAGSNS